MNDNLNQKLNELIELDEEIIKELELLDNDESVILYNKLKRLRHKFLKEIENLYHLIKEDKIRKCDHIIVTTPYEDWFLGRLISKGDSHLCVKCGMDSFFLEKTQAGGQTRRYHEFLKDEFQNINEQCFTDIYTSNPNPEEVYQELILRYPNITDREAINKLRVLLADEIVINHDEPSNGLINTLKKKIEPLISKKSR